MVQSYAVVDPTLLWYLGPSYLHAWIYIEGHSSRYVSYVSYVSLRLHTTGLAVRPTDLWTYGLDLLSFYLRPYT